MTVVALTGTAQSNIAKVTGTVFDPTGLPLAGARVEFTSSSGARLSVSTASNGEFSRALPAWGAYTVHVEASGFASVTQQLDLNPSTESLTLRLESVTDSQSVIVSTEGVFAKLFILLASPTGFEPVLPP